MRKIFLLAFCTLVTAASVAQSNDRLIVRFKSFVNYSLRPSENRIVTDNPVLAEAFNRIKITRITALVPANASELNLASLHLVKDIHFIDMLPGTDLHHVKTSWEQTGLFEYVEFDQQGKAGGANAITPNDAFFSRQWGFYNNGTFTASGSVPAVAGADVKMMDAWGLTTGSSSVIVCILDSGLKMDHPEFAGRIWTNPTETANGVDDDGNGLIDDIYGWDWAYNDNNPTDDHGHGTNVTGITAASGNNSNGYAGVDWNCKVMVGKILNSSSSGLYSWWISGIYYAVSKGARVINMSVGGSGFSQSMKDVCDFAYTNHVAIFACMMNENNYVPYYPAAYQSTIAVGATDLNDYRVQPFFWNAASGSNYGSHIDVVAPGNYIYGLSYNSNTNFNSYWGGTSQATPLVAGIGSLMIALNPATTVDEIRQKLRATAADQVGRPNEDIAGPDYFMGYGRVNAFSALSAVLPVTGTKLFGELRNNSVTLSWKTFQEVNAAHFEIQVSQDIVNWETVAQVQAKGNSNTTTGYNFSHRTPLPGVSFYRYKQVDNDGKSEYSNIVRIWNEKAGVHIKTSNPAAGLLHIRITALNDEAVTLSLYNSIGALVRSMPYKLHAGTNYLQWNTADLSGGQYILNCRSENGEIQSLQIVK